MTIPVYLNTYNRISTTKILADQIARLDNARPVIIDNASTWGPLLDWYADCPYDVVRLRDNLGHHAPWTSGIIEQDAADWYVVTDCDLDLEGVPADCLTRLREPFDWPGKPIIKSGLSLRIDDVPAWQTQVLSWEHRFWKRPVPGGRFYFAQVDTTFAMYRGTTPLATCLLLPPLVHAVRSAQPYTARHVPWYLDPLNLDEENANYFATANASNSWRPEGQQLVARYAVRGTHRASRRV